MEFKEIKITDRERIEPYFYKYGEGSCQHTFINLFTLSEKYCPVFCEKDGFLYVKRKGYSDEKYEAYLFPQGQGDMKRAVENLLSDAHENGKKLKFQTVTESKKKFLEENFAGKFETEEYRDYFEYIYLTENLAELPKKLLYSKWRYAKAFRKEYEGRIEEIPMTKENADEVLSFAKKWLDYALDSHDSDSIEHEFEGIKKQMQYFDEIGIIGIIVRIDGEIQGFIYGVPENDEYFDAVVGKANPEIRNIYRILYQDIAKKTINYKYTNWEEDAGNEGLRNMKISYHPEFIMPKYIVTEK